MSGGYGYGYAYMPPSQLSQLSQQSQLQGLQAQHCGTLLNQYDPQTLDRFKLEMSQGIERFYLLSFCLACCWHGFSAHSNLRVVRQWAELEFNFPSPEEEQIARQKGYYVPGNSVPIDVEVNHRRGQPSRIFVTIPRFDGGRPMTLGTVDNQGRISAYPDYGWHNNQGHNCQGMTSVFRVAIDECNRLWVMDAGKIGDTQVCPPQLLAFDLHNDQLIYRHVVNASSYVQASLFITPVVDVRGQGPGDCSDTYVYVADVSAFGVLVVDVARDRSWRCTHRSFFPYPDKGTFTIDGESFDLMDGVLGMALSPYRQGRDRYLYFHALASDTENILFTNTIRNESRITHTDLDSNDVHTFGVRRTSQSAAEAVDRDGVMYFGLMDPPSIWCWNTQTDFSRRNFHQIAVDQETLQFASGVKVVNNLKGEQELWIMTSSFQRVMTGSLSSDRVNYRIHAEKINILLANSPCKMQSFPNGSGRRPGYHAHLVELNSHRLHNRYGAIASL